MAVGQKNFGVSRVNKDRPQYEAAKPHHGAAKIKRARLHHVNSTSASSNCTARGPLPADTLLYGLLAAEKLIEELLQNVPAHHARIRKRLPVGVKNRGRR